MIPARSVAHEHSIPSLGSTPLVPPPLGRHAGSGPSSARADNRTRHIREYDKFSGSLAKNPEAWGDFVCVDRTHLTTMDSPLVSMGGFPAA